MSSDHQPTRGGAQSGEEQVSRDARAGGRRRYHPTLRAGGGEEAYHSPGVSAGPDLTRTERLRVEPVSYAWLVLVEGIHAGHIFRLHSDATLIGRDPSCDIVLDDSAIGRHHARVRSFENEEEETIFTLHDLATENGTFVNDTEIVKEELEDGDRILIGRTRLVFKQIQP